MSIRSITSALMLLTTLLVPATTLPLSEKSLPYPVSPYSSSLLRTQTSGQPSSKYLRDKQVGNATLYSEYFDLAFLTNLTVGGQDFYVTIDTGSSDTCKSPRNGCLARLGSAEPACSSYLWLTIIRDCANRLHMCEHH